MICGLRKFAVITNVIALTQEHITTNLTLRETCQYLELFWSKFEKIRNRINTNTSAFHAVKFAMHLASLQLSQIKENMRN